MVWNIIKFDIITQIISNYIKLYQITVNIIIYHNET
jgi:hypothetical protein